MKRTLIKPLLYTLAGSALVPVAAQPALAQERSLSRIDEIVVTARRREENIQSTPVAVTAVTQEALELKQIVNVADIQRAAPNLGITQGATAGSQFIYVTLRGQQNLQAGVGNDPAVGIYVDGIYMARPSTGVFDLNDVSRVEVLRGPQGTLFGRNTIGGAINIVTNAPSDQFEGRIRGEVGNYDSSTIAATINIPVTDDLAVRLSGHHKQRDGFGENLTLGQDAADLDRDDYLRLAARYRINDDWDLTYTADFNEIEDSGVLNALSGWRDATGAMGLMGIDLDQYLHRRSDWYKSYGGANTEISSQYTPFDMVRTYGHGLTINGDLGWAEFKSITSWRSSSSVSYQDLDGTPVGILDVLSYFSAENITQELQLSGGDRLSWTSGLFYFRETGKEGGEARTFGFLDVPIFENLADVENTSYAAYLQTYYDLTDKLRVVAGFRYTWDERDTVLKNRDRVGDPSSCNVPNPDGGSAPPCRQTQQADFDYPAWLLGLDYQYSDDIFLYVKTSGASMAGGWNLRQGSLPAYDPQDVMDVEIGIKADWFDQRLRTNVALFHTWQSDVQRNISDVIDGRTTQYVRNAGDSKIHGVEFEGILIPWEGMEITATFGWMKGEYDSGSYTEEQPVVVAGPTPAGCTFLEAGPAPGTASVACFVDRSGEELLQLPEISYSIGATQTWPTDFGRIRLHGDYSYIDDQTFFEQTAASQHDAATRAVFARANELGRIDGYGLWNASLALEFDNPRLSLALWGRNLANKKYVQMNFAELYSGLGTAVDYVGDPRTWGLTLTYDFGG